MSSLQIEPLSIPGSAPNEVKELIAKFVGVMFWNKKTFFAPVAKGLRIEEVSLVHDLGCPARKRTVWRHTYSVEVTKDMCNSRGFMHDGCTALLIDNLTSMMILVLHLHAVSVNLSINFMGKAKVGTSLFIVTTGVVMGDDLHVLRAELYDRSTGEMLYSTNHTKALPSGGPRIDDVFTLNSEEEVRKSMPNSPRLIVEDPSMIGGNAPAEVKQKIFDSLTGWSQEGIFGAHITRTLSLQNIDVDKLGKKMKPVIVGEIGVSQAMTNGWGAMHGGCGSFLIAQMTQLLTIVYDGPWVASTFSCTFHAPAMRGMTIRLVSTPISIGRRIMNLQCETYDSKSGRLLQTAVLTALRDSDQARL
ncbi:hypothetical protein SCHPADRAFT_992253 [Schizopora paradoxa]|uniref:Thioesterase domain-containing protein n=1 Tax=Schizopora paradoxa TaxID=27342 RepID=A0A0H2SSQ6_9AGAM|nr:hypothetical protein SCHPADRAFT_992253 [Schizopora paradoxa]